MLFLALRLPTLVRVVVGLIKRVLSGKHPADIKHGRTHSIPLTSSMAGPTPLLWPSMQINLSITSAKAEVIAKVSHFHHLLREALKIENRPNNLNRDDGWNKLGLVLCS